MEIWPFDILYLLSQLGISTKNIGFFQTACAVELCRGDPEKLLMVTKKVYPEVAKQYGTSSSAVERNIRAVCGIAWENNRRFLEHLAHKTLLQKPSNTQFLAILLNNLPPYHALSNETDPPYDKS